MRAAEGSLVERTTSPRGVWLMQVSMGRKKIDRLRSKTGKIVGKETLIPYRGQGPAIRERRIRVRVDY